MGAMNAAQNRRRTMNTKGVSPYSTRHWTRTRGARRFAHLEGTGTNLQATTASTADLPDCWLVSEATVK